jgi:uroporphyrinogen decarboxylase
MNSRELIERCLSGKKMDRIPVALWRHFPVDDQSPHRLAAASIAFQRMYGFDLIKVTPASSFCVRDWGVQDTWRGNPEGTRDYDTYPVNEPEDWLKLNLLHPDRGGLSDQLVCLKLICDQFIKTTPVIQTIFNPLSQAKNLVGREKLLVHMRQHPEAVHAALKIITATTMAFIEEVIKTGLDGIFFAVQHAQYHLLSKEEFLEFGKRYDLEVMGAVKRLWLNFVHIHGENIMFDQVADYPAAVFNWHDLQTRPSLSEALKLQKGLVCGGLRQWETMALGTPEQVSKEARVAITATDGKRFILGTGCVMPLTTPHGNIIAALRVAGRPDISD